ncbi:MAG TPA: hypothetical protein VK579_12370 [Terriglobales bacterium]|nr:hypothetical protein [Terriglobales bacterium]
MNISNETRVISGILLITVPTIASGGAFLLRLLRQGDATYVGNPLRQNMFRAGHAHAGVLVLLSLVCQLLADVAELPPALVQFARLGVPCAAVLMPLGFFLSVASPKAVQPNRLITLIYIGAALLATSVLVLGIGLIRSALT